MSKHTRGPWQVHQLTSQSGIYDASGNRLASVRYVADARLIAAAPTMLEALRELVRGIEETPELFENAEQGVMARARAAIAAAEGDNT